MTALSGADPLESAATRTRSRFLALREHLDGAYDLARAATLLGWDELCMMPKGGGQTRAHQKATLERAVHSRFTALMIRRLLDQLAPWAESLDPESFPALYIRVAREQFLRYAPIPADLVGRMSLAASRSYRAWLDARDANDFSIWAEQLGAVVALLRELADVLGYEERPYDAILARREPGVRASVVEGLFEQLSKALIPLARRVGATGVDLDDQVLHQRFDDAVQYRLGLDVLRDLGFDFERGRVDFAVHPISYSISPNDVRLAVRTNPDFFSASFFSFLHEGGHGLYFQGVPEAYARTPLDGSTAQGANLTPVFGGIATSLHEGQSRLWENVLGRSRAFWTGVFPRVATAFPAQTSGTDAETWYRAVNRTRPTLIRMEADELTYDLHIMLRFDLESGLINGTLPTSMLRDAWNAGSLQYLGVSPPDDRTGVLQDIQWSRGGHGGFPSYTLGNVMSMQFWERMMEDVPDMDARIAAGDYLTLRTWMERHIHAAGSAYGPLEMLQRVVGRAEFDPDPYIAYLTRKFGDLYAGADRRDHVAAVR